jgi:hypothetical protein
MNVSDPDRPPPGIDPSAWRRWLERQGQPLPLDLPGRTHPDPRPDEPTRADPPDPVSLLRARLEVARAQPHPPTELAIGLDDLTTLLERLDRLASALHRYGQHAPGCQHEAPGARCTCGLSAAL